MKYLDYRENKIQGTFDFPIAFYHVDSNYPHYQMTYHWHPEYELLRILSGSFQLTIDGQSVTAVKDDILFIQGGTLHGGIPEDCVYECIVFDMRLLLSNNKICNKQLQQLLNHEASVDLVFPNKPRELKRIVNEVFICMRDEKPGYEFMAQGALYNMLGRINELSLIHINTSKPTASALQIKRFKNVLSYIEDHYSEQIPLEEMARIAGLSPRYFCRFFRKMTQYTPVEYLNYYRIECACEQLAQAQATITDIALNCGFNDISYFIKSFHKTKGITPKQYKASNRHT